MADRRPATGPRRLDPEDLGDHIDRLYRAAWAFCGSREDAEDLVQETYSRVLARPRWLRNEDDLGYLLRALRNTFMSRARTAGRRPQTTELGEHHAEPVATRDSWQPEIVLDVQALFAVIAELPEHQRDALVAVDLAGLSYRHAARSLRIREATLTSRLHRARARLATVLGADGFDGGQP